jgi:threonine dehydrogenase-like Zn-dependent dehydrogenase
VAGRIEAVGRNVTQLQPGDEVFGWCDGAFAEYASVPEGQLVPKPTNLTFEQAAAVPISAFAALQALRDTGQVQPGQKVVITGASGGVGTFAVQLAKAFGADVTGVCSTQSVDMVRSIGADHVIDYTQEDFTRSGQRYDLILEMAVPRDRSGSRNPSSGADDTISGTHRLEPFIANVRAAEQGISTVERKTGLDSDQVLQQLAAGLRELGFAVESGKKASERIRRPVLFGSNGHAEVSYEIDASTTATAS